MQRGSSNKPMCMGFTAVTKKSGIDGQNQQDLYNFKTWMVAVTMMRPETDKNQEIEMTQGKNKKCFWV